MVLPCMGSDDHTTCAPSRFTARTSGGSFSATLSEPKRAISVRRPGIFCGLSTAIRRSRSSGSSDGPHFRPMGFLMPRQNSTWAPSSWRVRSPIHSICARGVVPVAAGGIDARHRLLVGQQQRFVAGVEIGGAQLRHRIRGDAAGRHEVQRFGNALRQTFILFAGRRVRDEAQHPAMDIVQIGITALREGAQQIERRRRLGIGLHQPLRIGNARFAA